MTPRALDVWMNGERVGVWRLVRGEHELDYAPSWLASPHPRPLSPAMPPRPPGTPYRTNVVLPYFDNLLPDSEAIRRRLAARFGLASAETFALLAELGRDCVGAVQLVPEGTRLSSTHQIRGRALTASQVAQALIRVPAAPLRADETDDFRISLAGAQEKTAFLKLGRRWAIPEGATPTTHIFKLPIGGDVLDLRTSVENEWLCAQLLPALGVPCARCEMATFRDQRVLIVERFDRRVSDDGTWIIRLPQEDLCQATATPRDLKYESDGGPGIARLMALLRGADREDFFRTQLVFWLLCAIDGHAKNFSIFLEPGGGYRLTPRYDVLSAYPVLGPRQLSPHKAKLAMAVWGANRHYRWKEIGVRHWLQTGRDCGLADGGRALLEAVLAQVPAAIAVARKRLPRGFPAGVSGAIFEGLAPKAADARRQR